MEHNLKWQTKGDYIPVIIDDSYRQKALASITFDDHSKVVIIKDLRTTEYGHFFPARDFPESITVKSKLLYLSDKTIDNLLLHELCHWYTNEKYYGRNIQSHGSEFKKCAREIKLPSEYANARTPQTKSFFANAKDLPAFLDGDVNFARQIEQHFANK